MLQFMNATAADDHDPVQTNYYSTESTQVGKSTNFMIRSWACGPTPRHAETTTKCPVEIFRPWGPFNDVSSRRKAAFPPRALTRGSGSRTPLQSLRVACFYPLLQFGCSCGSVDSRRFRLALVMVGVWTGVRVSRFLEVTLELCQVSTPLLPSPL